jgi:uncharacterized protein (TIGR00369 family)
MTNSNPIDADWTAFNEDPMPSGLGISWRKWEQDHWIYGLQTRKDHANRNGVIHGGILLAFADHTLGNVADTVSDGARHATVQLNTHFLAAAEVGDFLELRGEVTRAAGTMAFVRAIVSVGQKNVLAVDGIWRIFRPRTI